MSSREKSSSNDRWQLQASKAQLSALPFAACVDLVAPEVGLQQLRCEGAEIKGHFLGVSAGDFGSGSRTKASVVFTRGDDLIARFAETEAQPYSLEVYWRAISRGKLLVVDLLLSLETLLLESFPSTVTHSQLDADETWLVSTGGYSEVVSDFENLPAAPEASCLVLRPTGASWSYAEMSHPDDVGKVTIARDTQGRVAIQRDLAGTFLEKGVIRRLRVRSAMVPREEDLQLAGQLLQELATEIPPLTA